MTQDRQKAEARVEVGVVAKKMGYALAELVGSNDKPNRAQSLRNTSTRRPQPSHGHAAGASCRDSVEALKVGCFHLSDNVGQLSPSKLLRLSKLAMTSARRIRSSVSSKLSLGLPS